MFRHFPLDRPQFAHQFGISAYSPQLPILQNTKHYQLEIDQRTKLLDSPFRNSYLIESPGFELATSETIETLLERCDYLHFVDGRVINETTQESISLSQVDFDWIGRNAQEDVVLLSNRPEKGYPIVGGCVCFPSGWSIDQKAGQSILAVHQDVPGFEQHLYAATEKLMGRLKPLKTVWRTNWGIRPTNQLDQSPRHADFIAAERDLITNENAGTSCFFRVEFQTLTRLPCGDIVFTIHTEQCCLAELTEQQRRNLLGVLKTCPDDTLAYKGIAPMLSPIVSYLEAANAKSDKV